MSGIDLKYGSQVWFRQCHSSDLNSCLVVFIQMASRTPSLQVVWFQLEDLHSFPVHPLSFIPCMHHNSIVLVSSLVWEGVFTFISICMMASGLENSLNPQLSAYILNVLKQALDIYGRNSLGGLVVGGSTSEGRVVLGSFLRLRVMVPSG